MKPDYRQFCAIARTLDVVGQRWTLLVVRELDLRGPLSAAALARGLPDVPMNQLTERLALLESRGLVDVREDDSRARVYGLTEAGQELEAVLGALAQFGLDHLAGAGAEPDDAVLPHVLMRHIELRYDRDLAAAQGFSGRFELELEDPAALWSVEPGVPAAARWAVRATPDGLSIRAGASLEPAARLTASVDTWTRFVAGDPKAGLEVEVEGDTALADGLLDLLVVPPVAPTLSAAAA